MLKRKLTYKNLIQFNWYRYALTGFTEVQRISYGRNVRYYSQLVKATPPWANLNKVWDMFLFAAICRACDIDMQTDHIIPVNHPHVCGLHCEANLQHLTELENNRKSNKWWPDMWSEGMQFELFP